MIVQRFTWKVKKGCTEAYVDFFKAAITNTDPQPKKWRIYTPNIGEFDRAACEVEFENLAELEKVWSIWSNQPGTAEFYKKFDELTETGGGIEIWDLVEN